MITCLEVSIPVAVLHIIDLLRRSLNCAGDPGVTPRPPGEEFKVRPRLVLVTLEAVIEAPVRLVIILACDPTPNTELKQETMNPQQQCKDNFLGIIRNTGVRQPPSVIPRILGCE